MVCFTLLAYWLCFACIPFPPCTCVLSNIVVHDPALRFLCIRPVLRTQIPPLGFSSSVCRISHNIISVLPYLLITCAFLVHTAILTPDNLHHGPNVLARGQLQRFEN